MGKRRTYIKLHTIIALAPLAIILRVTKSTKHDSPILEKLLKPIPKGGGETVTS